MIRINYKSGPDNDFNEKYDLFYGKLINYCLLRNNHINGSNRSPE